MNKSITFATLFALIILQSLTFSCKKEEQDILPAASSNQVHIQEAKQWFDQFKNTTVANGSREGRVNLESQVKKEPLWKAAITQKFTKSTVLEVPLAYERQTGLVMKGKDIVSTHRYQKEHSKKLSTQTKLLISKDAKGEFKLSIMKLIGEEAYLKKHNFNSSNNTFGKKEEDFSGMVMYYDWEENFINGFQYEKGKIKGEVFPTNQSQSTAHQRRAVCSTFYVDYYQNVCYTSDVSGWTCSEWVYVDTESYTTCQYIEEGGTDNGGGVIEEGEGYYGGSSGDSEGNYSGKVKIPGIHKPGIDVHAYLACFGMLPTEGRDIATL